MLSRLLPLSNEKDWFILKIREFQARVSSSSKIFSIRNLGSTLKGH
jgi:hypothetical protein